jgi:hypothetical protein
MTSLAPVSAAFGEAVQALQRCLEESRGAWDDGARQTFDRRFAERIVTEGKRSLVEMQKLTEDVDFAVRLLESLR